MTSEYRHEPLLLDKEQIRLLKFDFSQEGEIRASLQIFDMDDSLPPYQALSYVWGPEEPKQSITITTNPAPTTHRSMLERQRPIYLLDSPGGKSDTDLPTSRNVQHSFAVRQNLYDFLEAAVWQTELEKQHTWIDQLCIDQKSTMERNHQVQLMGQIYRRAQRVISWLGKHSDPGFPALVERMRPVPDPLALATRLYVSESEKEVWRRFCSVPYWTRHWVIQELFLARSCIVAYGEDVLPFGAIFEVWGYWMGGLRTPHEEHMLEFFNRASIYAVDGVFDVTEQTADRLLRLVLALESTCEDDRDKIYGLQNLLPPSLRTTVDYNKSLVEVYLETAIIIKNHQTHWKSLNWHLAVSMGLVDKSTTASIEQFLSNKHLAFSVGSPNHGTSIIWAGSAPRWY